MKNKVYYFEGNRRKRQLAFVLAVFVASAIAYPSFPMPAKEKSAAEVTIAWEYKDVAVPITVHALKGKAELWKTASVKRLADAPVGDEIKSARLEMKPGESREIVLVMQNTTDKPIYFFAAPHQVEPAEYSLGFKFHCLCVNMTYTVMPGSYWYRVVKLDVYPGFRGERLTVLHKIIGVDRPMNVHTGHANHDL